MIDYVRTYLQGSRRVYLPKIKDFSKDYPEYKYGPVSKLSWEYWFWFHHTSYAMFTLWLKISVPMFYMISAGIAYYLQLYFIFIITAIMGLYSAVNSYNQIKLGLWKNNSFYEYYLKD